MKKLKYVESIVRFQAKLFKVHIRYKVIDDKDTLKKLIAANDQKALEFYERYYEELCNETNYKSQSDLMNQSVIQFEIPECVEANNLTIGDLHEQVLKRNSETRKKAWAEMKAKKKKTKSNSSLPSKKG